MADSYNELFGLGTHSGDANLEGWWPLQDDAASTVVVDESVGGNTGTLLGGNNTSAISGTGPITGYLGKALHLDGANDRIDIGDLTALEFSNSDAYTWGAWAARDGSNERGYIINKGNGSVGAALFADSSTLVNTAGSFTANGAQSSSVFTGTGWHHCVATNDISGTPTSYFYQDGSSAGSDTFTSGTSSPDTSSNALIGGRAGSSSSATRFDGRLAEVVAFSRALTATEVSEIHSGPEPVNTSAPGVTGAEEEGQALTATTGTWGLDAPFASGSNGTITYTYQWYRADDAIGTNEAAIAGATATTYSLGSADVGKFLRVLVRGTNDGGFDSAADTYSSYTGAIAASGGGGGSNEGAAMYHHLQTIGAY